MARCKICRSEFVRRSMTHKCCGPDCAAEYAKRERMKAELKELRKRKLAIKPRSKWLAEAQMAFNEFIRVRDAGLPCISCGRYHQGQNHAGHYRSVGACPELRFNQDNVHLQCAPCNNHKSGNVVEYRIALIQRIGIERVEWLEGPHEPKHYTIEDAQRIKAEYKAKTKALRAEQERKAA